MKGMKGECGGTPRVGKKGDPKRLGRKSNKKVFKNSIMGGLK